MFEDYKRSVKSAKKSIIDASGKLAVLLKPELVVAAATLGDVAELYDQVDALDGSYCARKYGEARKLDRLRRIMRGITPEPVKSRSDLRESPAQDQHAKEEEIADRLRRLRAKNDPFQQTNPK